MTDFTIIGKVKGEIETRTTDSGLEISNIFVEAKRNYRNKDKEIEVDIYQLSMFKGLADEVKGMIQEGSNVVVKGHFTANNGVNKERAFYFCNLTADRIELMD